LSATRLHAVLFGTNSARQSAHTFDCLRGVLPCSAGASTLFCNDHLRLLNPVWVNMLVNVDDLTDVAAELAESPLADVMPISRWPQLEPGEVRIEAPPVRCGDHEPFAGE
jgi:hypothetical protein